jgi:hypothetical protein
MGVGNPDAKRPIMARLRITVASLMILVVYLAFALAALRDSSYLWLRTVNTIVVAILFIAVLAAKHCSRSRSAFAFGFALFGWGYFFLVFGPSEGWPNIVEEGANKDEIRPNLVTSDLVRYITSKITPLPIYGMHEVKLTGEGEGLRVILEPGEEKIPEMRLCSSWIGHLLLTLLIGGAGGLISLTLASQGLGYATRNTRDG